MPVINRIAGFAEEMTAWRQYLHRNPEHGLECHETARFVVEKLQLWCTIFTGIAPPALLIIKKGSKLARISADMDALPLAKQAAFPGLLKHQG